MKKYLPLLFFPLLIAACGGQPDSPEGRLASCLEESGAVMYGTSWCQYCAQQRALFAPAELDEIDCDLNRARCQKLGITGYPTWIFADGSRQEGVTPLDTLAQRSSCTDALSEPVLPPEEFAEEAAEDLAEPSADA